MVDSRRSCWQASLEEHTTIVWPNKDSHIEDTSIKDFVADNDLEMNIESNGDSLEESMTKATWEDEDLLF